MQILKLMAAEVRIPLRFRFSQSNNPASDRSMAIILEVRTTDGVSGFGECCPRTYVTGESVADVMADLARIGPNLEKRSISSTESLRNLLREWEEQGVGPSTRCALELALLDAWSRTRNTPLVQLLGGTVRDTLRYSLILPMMKPKNLAGLLVQLRGFQPPDVKLKVDSDLESALGRIEVIRQHLGQDISVRIDVNGGWTPDEAERCIPKLIAAGVTSFEQPLAADQYEGMAELTRRFGDVARIMADESLTHIEDAHRIVQMKAANHFNLKISKLGGILPALEIYQLAAAHHIPCQLGAHFGETSLLTAAGILFSTLAGDLTAHEGALGDLLLEKDITIPSIRHDPFGRLSCSDLLLQPGWFTSVSEEALALYTHRPVD